MGKVNDCPVCRHSEILLQIERKTVKMENQTVVYIIGVCDNCGCVYHYDTEYLSQQSL